jgi:hypothetical protein
VRRNTNADTLCEPDTHCDCHCLTYTIPDTDTDTYTYIYTHSDSKSYTVTKIHPGTKASADSRASAVEMVIGDR